ncbi:MAG: ImmA/IrrE family metallo-endopeptidase [Myxococcaceae bacterium]
MALKVRFLTDSEIESACLELLRKFAKADDFKLAPPIPIEGVIERYLKIDLGFDDLRNLLGASDVLGATWFEHARIRVDSSLEEDIGRSSFTMAHEVGHWWLHRPQYEADKLTLGLIPLGGAEKGKGIVCRSGAKKEPAEWQADQFASRFLMPTALMREAFKRLIGEPVVVKGLATARESKTIPLTWRETASKMMTDGGFTNVSNEAMRYRLEALHLVVDADEVAGRLL